MFQVLYVCSVDLVIRPHQRSMGLRVCGSLLFALGMLGERFVTIMRKVLNVKGMAGRN